jgi:hypothetical protein
VVTFDPSGQFYVTTRVRTDHSMRPRGTQTMPRVIGCGRFGRHSTGVGCPVTRGAKRTGCVLTGPAGRAAEASLRSRKCPVQLGGGLLYQLAELVRYI